MEKELLHQLVSKLNETDETHNLEAKKASELGKSVLESICAFSNEPDLGGGYILLGVEQENQTQSLFPSYVVTGLAPDKLDKIQADISSQCADIFNIPIRPQIAVEQTQSGKFAIVVKISELSKEQKPLYFKAQGLPQGAYRRIGSTDQRCTEDDLLLFYQSNDTLDNALLKDSDEEDISEDAIEYYRKLRYAVKPSAEELSYDDKDLLKALNGTKKNDKGKTHLTYTGLLCFGKRMALRRLLPMVRVDYIRLSTNKWIGNVEERFKTTLDMRGPLLEMVQRLVNTVIDDLPQGFVLDETNLQAKHTGLPYRVLREAIVNAFIHRSYRINSPIQLIRYPNRIEIINPGYSLKSEEQLGEPGSINRNPFIATIFHETNLAETKGSGIRTMRKLMEKVEMMPPTFESNRLENKFTTRLLLHHLLTPKDLEWINSLGKFELNDNQKRIIFFLREVHAVDNSVARQINGSNAMEANKDLRELRGLNLIVQKGDSRKFTYYIAGSALLPFIVNTDNEPSMSNSAPLSPSSALPVEFSALPKKDISAFISTHFSEEINNKIQSLGEKVSNKEVWKPIILELCKHYPLKISEIAKILGKTEKYILREFVKPLKNEGKLVYKFPDMPNHPEQAYITKIQEQKE